MAQVRNFSRDVWKGRILVTSNSESTHPDDDIDAHKTLGESRLYRPHYTD